MIKIIDDILNQNELLFLNDLCRDFKKTNTNELDGVNNFYNSMFIDDYSELSRFKDEILKIVSDLDCEYDLNNPGIFINKVDTTTNQNDGYHRDGSHLTFIVYLNHDFEGGGFEYIQDGELHQITPRPNLTIFMDNTVLHRVLPVVRGERYSLITWLFLKNKKLV